MVPTPPECPLPLPCPLPPSDGSVPAASRFMAYQRPLRTSQEYTAALRAARALAERVTGTLRRVPGTDPSFQVFPYA